MTCDDIEAEVVEMDKGELIKITDSHVVNRTDRELVCKGTGVYSDNDEIMIRYRYYVDEDDELMVAYDTDEVAAAAEAQEQQEADETLNKAYREIDRIFDGS